MDKDNLSKKHQRRLDRTGPALLCRCLDSCCRKPREYYTKHLGDKVYSWVPSARSAHWRRSKHHGERPSVCRSAGADHLKAVAPGWNMWSIMAGDCDRFPLFWVLATIRNWCRTGACHHPAPVMIKLGFYPLSAASYRSMAQMRNWLHAATAQGAVWRRSPETASGHDGAVQDRED